MTNKVIVKPCKGVSGSIEVPGDKSISHRLALLSGLASGTSEIRNFLLCEDCLNTLKAVESLGAVVKRCDNKIEITGTNGIFKKPEGVLDLGNSGTGMRLLAGLLAGQNFISEMTGDTSLCSRPMGRIKKPLELMGARVELSGDKGCAPMRVIGSKLHCINYVSPVASAQVKSCILLAGLYAEGETLIEEPSPSRDHTEKLFAALNIPLHIEKLSVSVRGTGGKPLSLPPGNWVVPGDFSSAAFWMTAASARQGDILVLNNVGINPRRTAFADVLRRMGAMVEITNSNTGKWEPTGTIKITGNTLQGTEVMGDEIANLIDELPLVAVAGALARGKTIIKNAQELRVKETDRISAMASNMRAVGVMVEEKPDGMIIEGCQRIRGGVTVDSFGDHRIAMAMAVLAMFADDKITIKNISCVDTSYPGFWKDLLKIVKK